MESALYEPVGRLCSPLSGSNFISVEQIFIDLIIYFKLLQTCSDTLLCVLLVRLGGGGGGGGAGTPAASQTIWPSVAFRHG